jgi:hypothetical protein
MSNYKVGYGNPPVASRFRAGVSGNAKGRPKREESSVAEHIKRLLDTPIEYREGGRIKVATHREIALRKVVDNAVSGDLGAAALVLRIVGRAERHSGSSVDHILVKNFYAQEYLAEFVDWSGVAFFSREKLLVDNQPPSLPTRCEAVFAVIDTASKTGTDNDATAVTFFAVDHIGRTPLLILDWDITQIEGALLETWLPQVFARLEELARACRARRGSIGAFIEDKNSGTILLQQALRRQMPARAIDSKLTAMGKDERAISVSGYVHRESVKYTDRAFEKTVIYKRRSRKHLLDQVESFRVGDRESGGEDDLLDTFCYGIALALGNSEGF